MDEHDHVDDNAASRAPPASVERGEAAGEPDGDAGHDAAGDAPDNPFGLFPIIMILVLLVSGLFVVFRLRDSARTQDCVWSGRKNCAPIDPSNP